MTKYQVTYYTLSDGQATVTVDADNEAEARAQVREREDCDRIVSSAEVQA